MGIKTNENVQAAGRCTCALQYFSSYGANPLASVFLFVPCKCKINRLDGTRSQRPSTFIEEIFDPKE